MTKFIRSIIRNKHSIGLFDTGKVETYAYGSRGVAMRNEGFHFFVWVVSCVVFIMGFIVLLITLLDTHSFAALVVAIIMMTLPVVVGFFYLTHRNFGLDKKATRVNDAIYRLDKKERKTYGVSAKDIQGMSAENADALVNQIDKYLVNRAKTGPVGNLFDAMKSYNETMDEHFKAQRDAEAEARGRMKHRQARGF